MIAWVDKNLQTNPQSPLINMRYFSAYDPRYGFRFSVERIHGITQRMPHFVVTSITPPSSLYSSPPRMSNDVAFFTDYNWDGPWNSLLFHEDLLNYVGLAPNIKLGFVIELQHLLLLSYQIIEATFMSKAFSLFGALTRFTSFVLIEEGCLIHVFLPKILKLFH